MSLTSNIVPTGSAHKTTTAIVNGLSGSGFAGSAIVSIVGFGVIATVTGALTANTLSTILNITGTAGTITQLTIRTADATARTIRAKLTIDGSIIYDNTTASISTGGAGILLSGTVGPTYAMVSNPIQFKTSFKLEVASSLSETAKFVIEYAYVTES